MNLIFKKHAHIFELILQEADYIREVEKYEEAYDDSTDLIKYFSQIIYFQASYKLIQKFHSLGLVKNNTKLKVIDSNSKNASVLNMPSNEVFYNWIKENQDYYLGGNVIFLEEDIYVVFHLVGTDLDEESDRVKESTRKFVEVFEVYGTPRDMFFYGDGESPYTEFTAGYYYDLH